jgi:YidC/Oxa1 family membrane protein insertase
MGQIWDAIREGLGAVVSAFYQVIPNLGVAIILLTVAVGVLLFPLTLKQTRSMKAMQELQPELKRLQKEYAGDKQGMQQATMDLYKERGVNPAAGCLPLVLQMPVWFALYQVLRSFSLTTVEDASAFVLRGSHLQADIASMGVAQGAPWKNFLWMDLGTSPRTGFELGWVTFIPYVIAVLLVMATAWYQQVQTTPKQKDGQSVAQQPGQAILKIFPVFFGFISFTLPAGLVVYFAASSLFRIGQQSLILWLDRRRRAKVPDGATVVPAVEAEPERSPRPTRATGTQRPQGKAGGTGGSTRSPQASQQRGKKRRRR